MSVKLGLSLWGKNKKTERTLGQSSEQYIGNPDGSATSELVAVFTVSSVIKIKLQSSYLTVQ